MLKHVAFIVLLFVIGSAPRLEAQILDDGNSSSNSGSSTNQAGSYYNFSGGGSFLNVSVWGYVQNPGRYNVPIETNLIELLSYCGGPIDRGAETFLYRVKIIRLGGTENDHEIARVFEVDVDKYLQLTDDAMSTRELLLFPGDLIIVDGKESRGDTILRIAQIVVAITSIITSTIAVINLTK